MAICSKCQVIQVCWLMIRVKLGAIPRSPDIYFTVEENPRKILIRPSDEGCGTSHHLLLTSVGLYNVSGREKEGKGYQSDGLFLNHVYSLHGIYLSWISKSVLSLFNKHTNEISTLIPPLMY